MAEGFDAYHVWLGIPPKDQPPNHYRLLGLELFESDPGVIDNAADRQMGHLRRHQSGKHGPLSQKLLNEVAAARLCLLSAEHRQEYDSQLRKQLAPPEPPQAPLPPQAPPPPPPSRVPVASAASSVTPPPVPTASRRGSTPPPVPMSSPAAVSSPDVPIIVTDSPREDFAKRNKRDRAASDKGSETDSDGRHGDEPDIEPQPAAPSSWKNAALIGSASAAAVALVVTLSVAIGLWVSSGNQSRSGPIDKPIAGGKNGSKEGHADGEGPDSVRDVAQSNSGGDQGSALPAVPKPRPFELKPMQASPADVLAAIDTQGCAVKGTWTKSEDGHLIVAPPDRLAQKLLGTAPTVSLLAAPLAPPRDYELKLSVTRREGSGGLGVGLVLQGEAAPPEGVPPNDLATADTLAPDGTKQAVVFFDLSGTDTGMEGIDGKPLAESPAVRRGTFLLPLGEAAEIALKVEGGRVTAAVNGQTVVDWRGDPAVIKVPKRLAIPHPGALYLAADDASFEFGRIELSRIEAPPPMPQTPPPETPPLPAPPPTAEVPAPLARWTFNEDFRDEVGAMHGTPLGTARVDGGRLLLDGSGFVVTAPLPRDLTEKTLEVWVTLATPDQHDAGVMSVSEGLGRERCTYDAIAFTGPEQKTWQAASDGRRPTPPFSGAAEDAPADELIHLALVYQADGTVTLYRNGKPYGSPVRASKPATFTAGAAQVAFGRRAPPADGLLAGAIDQAQLFDRALTAGQVAKLAATPPAATPTVAKHRRPPPKTSELAAAKERVRLGYKDRLLAAKTPAQKRGLAQQMLDDAQATMADIPGRYALYLAARDAFAEAGDAEGMIAAVDRAAEDFKLDAYELKREALPAAGRSAVGLACLTLAKTAEKLATEAVHRDDFDAARQMLQTAYGAARQAKAFSLARSVSQRQKRLAVEAQKFGELAESQARLRQNPGDAEANLAVGLYRCFIGGDWVAGIAHLAAGNDAALQGLAEQEAAAPLAPLDRIKLGDGWWEKAESAGPAYRTPMRERAAHWYHLAAPQLEGGLEKLVAERRLLELETSESGGWRVLLRGTSPAAWNTEVDNEQSYAVPLAGVSDAIKFLRIQRSDTDQFVIVPITKELLVAGGPISPRVLWHNETAGSVQFLGIAGIALLVKDAGQPYIGVSGKNAFSGWGFGGLWQDAAGRSICWTGQKLTEVELEFSVKADSLTPEEQKGLLR